ncbi:MAG: helix-hairpin-helix domain-containing protein, partial [Blastocatellia bacterium]
MLLLTTFAFASCGQSGSSSPPANRIRVASNARSKPCVNLNTATAEELMRLPGIGEVMSRKIIEYRERNGPFRRPEEIIIIEGFSENKYRA